MSDQSINHKSPTLPTFVSHSPPSSFFSNRKSFNNQPAKPWGFWKTPVKSAQYEMMSDPGVAKLPGRAKTTF
jgi:hypothetical protein